jgi:hypothetical protein
VQRALAKADREVRLGFRRGLREVAEPVRRDAEELAGSKIRRMTFSPLWARMRTGITRKVVYVAPRQRGVKTRGADPRRRPNLAQLLLDRAMEPALDRHEHEIVEAFDRLLDKMADDFNH